MITEAELQRASRAMSTLQKAVGEVDRRPR